MRRVTADTLGGLATLVVTIGVASPALFGFAELTIPQAWWIVCFLVFLTSLVVSSAQLFSPVARYITYALACVLSWNLVITAPGMGLLLILLVITAVISVYLSPVWVGLSVSCVNTVLIAGLLGSRGNDVWETVLVSGFYLFIQFAAVLSSAALLREQELRRELAATNAELQTAHILLTESVKNDERLRLSRELHDLLGHQLTVLTLALEGAKHTEGSRRSEHLELADRTARELLSDVRSTVGQLRTRTPEFTDALRAMAEAVPMLKISYHVDEKLQLDEEQNAALLRATQEIVTNTLRHANARTLHVSVVREDGVVVLRAQDDGLGATHIQPGNGLIGITERFDHLGGEIVFDGRTGFAVVGRIPSS